MKLDAKTLKTLILEVMQEQDAPFDLSAGLAEIDAAFQEKMDEGLEEDLNEELSDETKKMFSNLNRALATSQKGKKDFDRQYMRRFLIKVPEPQRLELLNIIKAITLLTSGNVASVRSAGKTHSRFRAEPWKKIISLSSFLIMDLMHKDLGIEEADIQKKSTAEDYRIAHDTLEELGGTVTSLKNDDFFTDADNNEQKFDTKTLYRGMHDISDAGFLAIATSDYYQMPKAASTSVDEDVSSRFAQSQRGIPLLFQISNPEERGIDTRRISRYATEKEVILKGKLKIERIVSEKFANKYPLDIDKVKRLAKSTNPQDLQELKEILQELKTRYVVRIYATLV